MREGAKGQGSGRREKIVTLGPLIHNRRFVESLSEMGVGVISSPDEAEGRKVVIRSHGVEYLVFDELRRRNIEFIDATCPFVVRSQKIVEDLARRGIFTVIVGDSKHAEVKGLRSYLHDGQCLVTLNPLVLKDTPQSEIGLLAQTTVSRDLFERVCSEAKKYVPLVHIFNTICDETLERQQAVRDVAELSSIVLVVGGKNSSNTRKLMSLAKEIKPGAYHVESAGEVRAEWFNKNDIVGIVAGASTPDCQVEEIVEFLRHMFKSEGIYSEKQERV